MNPPVTTRAALARPGNGSRNDRLWQAIDQQISNRLHQAQRIDRDIIAAIIGSAADSAFAAAMRAALQCRGRR